MQLNSNSSHQDSDSNDKVHAHWYVVRTWVMVISKFGRDSLSKEHDRVLILLHAQPSK